jgi:hypothetical protein
MEKKASRNWLLRLALRMSGRLDSNQRPPEPHSAEVVTQSDSPQGVVAALPSVCTPVCTTKEDSGTSPSLASLAVALMSLTPEDRAQLAGLLLSRSAKREDKAY